MIMIKTKNTYKQDGNKTPCGHSSTKPVITLFVHYQLDLLKRTVIYKASIKITNSFTS